MIAHHVVFKAICARTCDTQHTANTGHQFADAPQALKSREHGGGEGDSCAVAHVCRLGARAEPSPMSQSAVQPLLDLWSTSAQTTTNTGQQHRQTHSGWMVFFPFYYAGMTGSQPKRSNLDLREIPRNLPMVINLFLLHELPLQKALLRPNQRLPVLIVGISRRPMS